MKKFSRLFSSFLLVLALACGPAFAAQNPIVIPNTGTLSGLSLVNATNAALVTLNTGWSGSSAPATPTAGQTWVDTSVANYMTVKIYDGAVWVPTGTIFITSDLFQNPIGGGTDTIASATTTDIGTKTAAYLTVTGTTAITGFGSSLPIGQAKYVTFAGALTLTNNGTSLILPGAANITTAAGDVAYVVSLGSGNYKVPFYQRQSGGSVGAVSLTSGVTGVLPVANGGTNQSTFTTGDMLYSNASNALAKVGIGSTGNVLTVAGGIPTWSPPANTPIEGTYTPTLTNGANVAASTAYVTRYLQMGKTVIVYGQVGIDPTGTGGAALQLGVSLPVASTFTNTYDLGGSTVAVNSTGTGIPQSFGITGDVSNARALIGGDTANAGNYIYTFTFTYKVLP